MYASVPARFRYMRLVLNTITDTDVRVVAACEPDPGHFRNTILQPENGHGTAGQKPRSSLFFASIPTNEGANLFEYEPFVHIRTGERAVIPFRVDPATGLRFVPPSQFVPAAVVEPQSGFLDGLFDRVFGRFTDPSVVPPPLAPLLASLQSPYGTFPTPRRIYFDNLGDHGGHGVQHVIYTLGATAFTPLVRACSVRFGNRICMFVWGLWAPLLPNLPVGSLSTC